MINLGLNRKISNVLSKNLNDPESDIYKEISSIASETTESDSGETTESDSSVNTVRKIIEDGRDSITSFVNEDITELGDYAFKDCVNLEHVYLPNCTKLGKDCFQNCTSLKTLLLPNVIQIDDTPGNKLSGLNNLDILDLSRYDSITYTGGGSSIIFGQSKFPKLRILSYGIDDLDSMNGSYGWDGLEILVLPNLRSLGHGAGFAAENIIIPNTLVYGASTAHLNGKVYVNDNLIDEYENEWGDRTNTIILPISQLPQEIREELELCQIQIIGNGGDGDDSITSFVNEDITELGDYAFKDCVNLEHVYLPNCTKLGKDCFRNCTSLKTLLLPNVTQIDAPDYIYSVYNLYGLNNLDILDLSSYDSNTYKNGQSGSSIYISPQKFPKLRILSYGIDGLANGGAYLGWDGLEILVLPNLRHLGHSTECRAENIIIPNTLVYREVSASINGKVYVNDDILSEYQNHERWHYKYDIGEILPISQLPQEIREELELCQIRI